MFACSPKSSSLQTWYKFSSKKLVLLVYKVISSRLLTLSTTFLYIGSNDQKYSKIINVMRCLYVVLVDETVNEDPGVAQGESVENKKSYISKAKNNSYRSSCKMDR